MTSFQRQVEARQHILTLLFVSFAFFMLGVGLTVTIYNTREVHCYGMGEKVNAPDEYPVYRMECNSVQPIFYVD